MEQDRKRKRFDLEDRVVIVTGGNRGIGLCLSRAFAEEGSLVVVVNRDAPSGKRAAEELSRQTGREVVAVAADVSCPDSVQAMANAVHARFGRIDVLVNNAAIRERKLVVDLSPEEWKAVIDVNLTGLFLTCQAVARYMIPRRYGKIVNISSILSFAARPGRAAYSASKGGVNLLTKALAVEWAPYQITVNGVAPTTVVTPESRARLEGNPERLQVLIDSHPLGRLAYPEDLAGAVLFLASPESDYVTGQVLLVDGGRHSMLLRSL